MIPAAPLSDRLAVDVQNLQALRVRAQGDDPETLREAARQFEALMVQTMLKTMRETRFTTEDDPLADTASLRMYRELLDQQWTQKLSEGRGLGFADMMVKQMRRPAAGEDLTAGAIQEKAPAPADQPWRREYSGAAAQQSASTDYARTSAQPTPHVTPSDDRLLVDGAASPETTTAVRDKKQAFIDRLLPHAQAAFRETGVPAHFILGHAALESGWGMKEIATRTGGASHNLFGIKAGPGWRGGVAETLTTEYQSGLPVKRSEKFRAYGDYTEAFTDYARLLKERYAQALETGSDARAFGRALASGGYATDPAYGEKLGRVIASVAQAGG